MSKIDTIKTKLELEVIGEYEAALRDCEKLVDLELPTIAVIQGLQKLALPYFRLTLVDRRTEIKPSLAELKLTEMSKRLAQTVLKRTGDITKE